MDYQTGLLDRRLQHWQQAADSMQPDFMIVRTPPGACRQPGPGSPVLPGSFNPLHAGHLEMARIASERCRRPCWFELSVNNVDKGSMNTLEVAARIGQNFADYGLVVTNTPQFAQKSSIFRGAVFAIGSDTLLRIVDPVYLPQDQEMKQLIHTFHRQDVRFLVFGRRIGDTFVDQGNIRLDDDFSRLCSFVSRTQFSMEISSSEIKARLPRGPDGRSVG